MTYQINKLNYENNTRFINESFDLTNDSIYKNFVIVKPLKTQGVRKVKNVTINLEAYMDLLVNTSPDEDEPTWQIDEDKIPVLQYALFYCSQTDPEKTFIMNLNDTLPNIISEDSSKIILNGFITPKSQVIQATRLARLLNAGDSIVLSIYNPEPLESFEKVYISKMLGTINYSIKYK